VRDARRLIVPDARNCVPLLLKFRNARLDSLEDLLAAEEETDYD
jgi:hypothetical protein